MTMRLMELVKDKLAIKKVIATPQRKVCTEIGCSFVSASSHGLKVHLAKGHYARHPYGKHRKGHK